MGYIPVDNDNAGYRDYNTDSVRDQPGDPYSIPTFNPDQEHQNNVVSNRAPRYADRAFAEE